MSVCVAVCLCSREEIADISLELVFQSSWRASRESGNGGLSCLMLRGHVYLHRHHSEEVQGAAALNQLWLVPMGEELAIRTGREKRLSQEHSYMIRTGTRWERAVETCLGISSRVCLAMAETLVPICGGQMAHQFQVLCPGSAQH